MQVFHCFNCFSPFQVNHSPGFSGHTGGNVPGAVISQPTPVNPNSIAQVPPAPGQYDEVSDTENDGEEDCFCPIRGST